MLQADIQIGSNQALHVFNIHLGTSFTERRSQGARLLSSEVLGQEGFSDPRLVVGDFNEWTTGLATRLLRGSFKTFRPHMGCGSRVRIQGCCRCSRWIIITTSRRWSLRRHGFGAAGRL